MLKAPIATRLARADELLITISSRSQSFVKYEDILITIRTTNLTGIPLSIVRRAATLDYWFEVTDSEGEHYYSPPKLTRRPVLTSPDISPLEQKISEVPAVNRYG